MRKFLFIMTALLTIVAFAAGAVAQEKKAPKPKAAKDLKVSGTVLVYVEGSTIQVKDAKDKEWTFGISADTKIEGVPIPNAKVKVTYKKAGEGMAATSISVVAKKVQKKTKGK